MKRKKLQQLRSQNNLTQEEVAEMLGISTHYYWMIENGQRTGKLELLKKLSDLFGVSVEEIFFEN